MSAVVGAQIAKGIVSGVIVVLAWWLGSRVIGAYVLPSPWDVFVAFFNSPLSFALPLLATLAEAVLGLIAAVAWAVVVGSAFAVSRRARAWGYQWVFVFQAVPVIALVPIVIALFGNGIVAKAAIACLVAVWPMIISVTDGLTSVDGDSVDLMRVMGANRREIFRLLRAPAAVRHCVVGLRVATSLAVIGAIVADFSASSGGIGHVIFRRSMDNEFPEAYAAVLLGCLLSLCLVSLVGVLESWARRKRLWVEDDFE